MFRLCGHSFWNTLLPGIHKFMIIELKGKKWVNCCLAKVEGGCLGYPGASTVASQPLDRIPLPWLANPHNPAMSPHSRHPSTLNESVEERKREGGVGECGQSLLEKPQNARDSKPSSASCLKTQTATWYAKANTLKQSWNEPCEPALEYVTADQEKVPA